jgi:hypothetical protein
MPEEVKNTFTRAILKQIDYPALREFVVHWDALEFLVIRVFRAKTASQDNQVEYQQLRSWLSSHYSRWQFFLLPYWKQSLVAGEVAGQDPFKFLLSDPSSEWFAGNWPAMQHLLAAREALNQFLIDRANPQL